MLKYLIVQLDDTSVSFCHYTNPLSSPRLISLDDLKAAIFWSMTENLSIQFVYPSYTLPTEYKAVIEPLDRVDIVAAGCLDAELLRDAEVIVFDGFGKTGSFKFNPDQTYVIKTTFDGIQRNADTIGLLLTKTSRLNIVVTDIERMNDDTKQRYAGILDRLGDLVKDEYERGHAVQFNLLTDRMFLDTMNNCNAGHESVTLAPDGRFYICPAFYLDTKGQSAVGDLHSGLDIPNQQLYREDHAPICRKCDAWHCRRCVWLNRRLTLEVNTPGRQQCITAHIERNASRDLLAKIRTAGRFLPDTEIPHIDYLDPFENLIKLK